MNAIHRFTANIRQRNLPYLGNKPVDVFLRSTAYKHRTILLANVLSAIGESICESLLLLVMFLLVSSVESFPSFPFEQYPLFVKSFLRDLDIKQSTLSFLVISTLLLALFAFQFLQSCCQYLNEVSTGYFAAYSRTDVTQKIRQHFFQLPYITQAKFKHGDLMDYIVQSPYALLMQIESLRQALVSSLLVFIYLFTVYSVSLSLLLATLLMGSVLVIVQKRLLPRIKSRSEEISRATSELYSHLSEEFSAYKLLRLSFSQQRFKSRLLTPISAVEQVLKKQYKYLSILGPFSNLLPTVAIASIIILALIILPPSTNILPKLTIFVICIQRASKRMSVVASSFTTYTENSGRIKRLDSFLSTPIEESPQIKLSQSNRHPVSINLHNVSYKYPLSPRLTLDKIDLYIPGGSSCAFVGNSGAGKTTLMNLMLGFIKPISGQILINSQNIDTIDQDSYHQILGHVDQDVFLFNSTVASNIALGSTIKPDELIDAAKKAKAHDFIEHLEDSYKTIVGERGVKLSGGQRQRLSIARALYKKPSILFLDEATSSLDSLSERVIQESLDELALLDLTVIIIAHRLSTVVNCDQIVLLDNGSIAAVGNHKQLLETNPLYANMWSSQTSGQKNKTP